MSDTSMDIDDDIMDIFNLSGSNISDDVLENTTDNKTDTRVDDVIKNYPVAPKKGEIVNVTIDDRKDQAQTDYDFSRNTLHHSIEAGSGALDALVTFAKTSGGPEAFKPVASIMDAIAKSAKQLLELQAQLKTADNCIGATTAPQSAQSITNNTTIIEGDATIERNETREEAMDRRKAERKAKAEKVVN